MILVLGIILIGLGAYVGWESHSILNWDLFQLSALIDHDHHITEMELQIFNSFVTDILYKLGADTMGEM